MDIVLDLTPIQNFFDLPLGLLMWRLFLYFGWMILAALYLVGAKELWLIYKRQKWGADISHIFLAIDIPRGNEQTPKAVENMFTYLAGAHGSVNFYEKWFEGKYQLSFSYEIVSIEGYTQFLVRTPEKFRNLIESSIYSQYPDAEISEIDDYTEDMPRKFPDDQYDLWGSEFILAQNQMFPIKMYKEFEHQLGPLETQFKDPMASFMDLCSSLGPGEQFWYQVIMVPIGFDWMDKADEAVDKILNKKKKSGKDIISKLIEWIGQASEGIYPIWQDIEDKGNEPKDESLSMMELTPKQKKQVEALQTKASKLAFEVKIRAIYIARKEVMNTSKVANGLVGYMKQFAALDLNNLKPDVKYTMTRADYFRRTQRVIRKKNNIINNYMARDADSGRNPDIMNIEELATLWHFPVEASVQAPLLQKAPGRKAEAPSSLPVSELWSDDEANEPDFLSGEVEDNKLDQALTSNLAVEEFEEDTKDKSHQPEDEELIKELEENVKPEQTSKTDPISKGSPPSNLPFA